MLLCCSDSYGASLLPQGGNPESFPWPTSMASGLQLPLRSPPLALFSSFFLLHDAAIHQLIFSVGLCVAFPTAWNAFSPVIWLPLCSPPSSQDLAPISPPHPPITLSLDSTLLQSPMEIMKTSLMRTRKAFSEIAVVRESATITCI